jgi:hypothetical protein
LYALPNRLKGWSLMGSVNLYSDVIDVDEEHEVTITNTILGSYSQFGANRGAKGLEVSWGANKEVDDSMRLGFQLGHVFDEYGSENELTIYWAQRW